MLDWFCLKHVIFLMVTCCTPSVNYAFALLPATYHLGCTNWILFLKHCSSLKACQSINFGVLRLGKSYCQIIHPLAMHRFILIGSSPDKLLCVIVFFCETQLQTQTLTNTSTHTHTPMNARTHTLPLWAPHLNGKSKWTQMLLPGLYHDLRGSSKCMILGNLDAKCRLDSNTMESRNACKAATM